MIRVGTAIHIVLGERDPRPTIGLASPVLEDLPMSDLFEDDEWWELDRARLAGLALLDLETLFDLVLEHDARQYRPASHS